MRKLTKLSVNLVDFGEDSESRCVIFSLLWESVDKNVKFQSQQALETARKDFGGVVVQAQKELTKLTVGNETPTSEHIEGDATPVDTSEKVGSSESTEESNASASTSSDTPTRESDTSISASQTFLSRLQASFPPNIVSTVQNHIPDSIRHVSENIDLGHLRSTLVSDFQRVQGVTLTQAEEYF